MESSVVLLRVRGGECLAHPDAKNIVADFCIKKGNAKNIKLGVQLGTVSYGRPVIAGGKVFVATNNEHPPWFPRLGEK